MGIKYKLLAGYLVVILAASVVGYFGVQQIQSIRDSYLKVNEQTIPLISSLQNIRASSLLILSATIEYAFIVNEQQLTGTKISAELAEEELGELAASRKQLNNALEEYSKLVDLYFPDERQYLKIIRTAAVNLISNSDALIAAKQNPGSSTNVLALKELLESNENTLLATFEKAMEHERKELDERKETVKDLINEAILSMISIGVAAFLLSLLSSFLLGRSVVRPLKQLSSASNQMAQGNFEQRINVKSNDELGKLAFTFNHMADELQSLYNKLEEKVQTRTKQLEQAHNELVKKERLATLGQVTAVVSHELRNPLGTIRSSLFTINEKTKDKQLGVERAIERAERNISRCDRIIEELLDYTRIRDLDFETIEFDNWIQGVLEEINIPNTVKIKLKTNVSTKVSIDTERVRRAVVNVINNAIEALTVPYETLDENPDNSKSANISINAHVADDKLHIDIEDNGPGIEKDQIEKIFEPLHSTKSFGVGLGLPITKQIIEQHNGQITFNSEPGRGTNVKIQIPVYDTNITGEVSNG